ncbi:putative cytochrome P450 monooxygenase [Microthyrium microscopicum]|uniref:Putative cytochrome P450 monooxygenase n=1 Tax=Microthyrium microscopicum TaxID=703497 RepID=A0A6A6U516_9PEZI|nr:putative cytochrome P450 monooxygenase [Microthyrium microscopicum]
MIEWGSITLTPLSSTVFLLAFSYLIYNYIIYPAFLSPLSKLPAAHFTSSLTPLWITYKRRTGYESRTIAAAHKAHGPIIQLAPNEVSVASLDGLRKIYTGGFERTAWFLAFANYNGTPNLVTLFDGASHARRKRMVSNIYSKSYLLRSEDFRAMAAVLLFRRFLPAIALTNLAGEGCDVYEMGCALGAEFISSYEMGTANGIDIVRTGRETARKEYLETAKRKFRQLRGKEAATKDLEDMCLDMCRRTEAFLALEGRVVVKDDQIETFPVVYAQLRETIPKIEGTQSEKETELLVASELLDNIEAGREGIGIALTYAMWHLSRTPLVQKALRKELLGLGKTFKYPLPNETAFSTENVRALDGLPRLDAVIHETLRLNAPAPGPQRRMVPEGGTTVDGYFIPAGITISASPYSMHRNEDIYPEADKWKPKRWMPKNDSDEKDVEREGGNDMRRWFWVFGSGGRMCVGNNFTLLVLKLVLAAIYTNYETTIIDDEGIEQLDDMMATPKGDKLILGFTFLSE